MLGGDGPGAAGNEWGGLESPTGSEERVLVPDPFQGHGPGRPVAWASRLEGSPIPDDDDARAGSSCEPGDSGELSPVWESPDDEYEVAQSAPAHESPDAPGSDSRAAA